MKAVERHLQVSGIKVTKGDITALFREAKTLLYRLPKRREKSDITNISRRFKKLDGIWELERNHQIDHQQHWWLTCFVGRTENKMRLRPFWSGCRRMEKNFRRLRTVKVVESSRKPLQTLSRRYTLNMYCDEF